MRGRDRETQRQRGEGQREGETESERDGEGGTKETERHRDRESRRERERQREIHRERKIQRQKEGDTETKRERHRDRKIERQTQRQRSSETERDRQKGKTRDHHSGMYSAGAQTQDPMLASVLCSDAGLSPQQLSEQPEPSQPQLRWSWGLNLGPLCLGHHQWPCCPLQTPGVLPLGRSGPPHTCWTRGLGHRCPLSLHPFSKFPPGLELVLTTARAQRSSD